MKTLVLLVFCPACFAAPSFPVLVPGAAVAGRLLPSASLTYRVSGGEFCVLLEQGYWDFAIDILEPATGAVRRIVNAFAYGSESASAVLGPALIRVRRVDSDAVPAAFALSVTSVSRADHPAAELRMRAEDAMTAAREVAKHDSAQASQGAIDLSREALALWTRIGEPDALLRSSLLLADSLHLAAAYDEALDAYSKALAVAGSPQGRAECLANRGSTYWRLGRFSEALGDMRESLAIWRGLPVQSGLASALSNLGLVLWEVGGYDDSIAAFHDAAGLMQTLGNLRGVAFVANNTALVQGTLGNYGASARSFERAAYLFDALQDRLAAGRAHTNSARIYLKLGRPAQAEIAVRRGLSLVETTGNQSALAEGLNLLGEVLAARGRKEDALDNLHRALLLARAAGDVRAEANSLTNIGRVLLTTTGRDAGIIFLQDSLKLWRRFGSPAIEASVLFHLAIGQRDRGNLAAARDSIEAAVKIAEGLRADISPVDLRIGFMADRLQVYDAAVDIFELSGQIEQAWKIAEMSRARGLLDSLAAGRTESDRQRQLRQVLNAESVRLARASSRGAEQGRKRLESISSELLTLQEKEAPQHYVLSGELVSLATLQHTLPGDMAVLEYTAGEPAYAWVITKESVFSFAIRNVSSLKSAALDLEDVMRAGDPPEGGEVRFHSDAATLAAGIVWPALPHLKAAKQILIVTDSRLEFPTAVLPLPGNGTLVDRLDVIEAPSAGMFVELEKREPAASNSRWPVAVIADGVFSPTDPRLTVPAPEVSGTFPRLLFSGREAAAIAALIPQPDRLLLLGFDATKQAFMSRRLREYPIIHVSTHSALRGKTAALVFSLVNSDGSPRDGYLTPDEVASADLRGNELLVLSACYSSAGPVVPGEGVQNLARSALLAGAARVIASRWPVDDEAASRLFKSFYTFLWQDGLSPSAALRKAQLALSSEVRFRSPYYWGAYFLVGKP